MKKLPILKKEVAIIQKRTSTMDDPIIGSLDSLISDIGATHGHSKSMEFAFDWISRMSGIMDSIASFVYESIQKKLGVSYHDISEDDYKFITDSFEEIDVVTPAIRAYLPGLSYSYKGLFYNKTEDVCFLIMYDVKEPMNLIMCEVDYYFIKKYNEKLI